MLQLAKKPNTNNLVILKRMNEAMKPATTSRKIAVEFGKEHHHVLRDIRNILKNVSEDFSASNFGGVEYIDKKGEKREEYIIGRDAYMLLVMGFTGKKALEKKLKFITYFNLMEQYIKDNEIYRLSVESRNRMNDAISRSGAFTTVGEHVHQEIAATLNMILFNSYGYPSHVRIMAEELGYSSIRDYIRNELPREERQMRFLEDYVINTMDSCTNISYDDYKQILQNLRNLSSFILTF